MRKRPMATRQHQNLNFGHQHGAEKPSANREGVTSTPPFSTKKLLHFKCPQRSESQCCDLLPRVADIVIRKGASSALKGQSSFHCPSLGTSFRVLGTGEENKKTIQLWYWIASISEIGRGGNLPIKWASYFFFPGKKSHRRFAGRKSASSLGMGVTVTTHLGGRCVFRTKRGRTFIASRQPCCGSHALEKSSR